MWQEKSYSNGTSSKKDIFIFFDGTANSAKSSTNVWKIKKIVEMDRKDNTSFLYVEGVGTLWDKPLTGGVTGYGMEERILRGYEYLIKNYRAGDKIYIFGFSRGAHQARALAGLLAYSGIPNIPDGHKNDEEKLARKILELTKEKSDDAYRQVWLNWVDGSKPPLANDIRSKFNAETKSVKIDFLGVWDTVPGSQFKDYDKCKEKADSVKGDRYKSDSYPNINLIAHAVSIDEKRSKFSPLLICPAIKAETTKIYETWFPGAHADVGGGYDDDEGLSGISLFWMLEKLQSVYSFNNPPVWIPLNYMAMAHWSVGDRPANIGSKCRDRDIPGGADVHESYFKRKSNGQAKIRKNGDEALAAYPLQCDNSVLKNP